MSDPRFSDLFDSPQELDEAAEERYLDTEFKLGGPTYPELPFEDKARLRQKVIELRVAGFLGAADAREVGP